MSPSTAPLRTSKAAALCPQNHPSQRDAEWAEHHGTSGQDCGRRKDADEQQLEEQEARSSAVEACGPLDTRVLIRHPWAHVDEDQSKDLRGSDRQAAADPPHNTSPVSGRVWDLWEDMCSQVLPDGVHEDTQRGQTQQVVWVRAGPLSGDTGRRDLREPVIITIHFSLFVLVSLCLNKTSAKC